MTVRDEDDMVPQFFFMEEDVDDPVDLDAFQEVDRTPSTPVNRQQDETPTTSSSTRSKRKTSPRDNVRRQTLCPSKWKVNLAKASFNAGKVHVTPKGALKRARGIKAGCKETCRKCSRRLLPPEREDLHVAFWNLSDINRKRDYISRHVKCSKPLTSHTIAGRTVSAIRTYTFTIDNKPVKVCKKMFLETLDIADCWVNTSLKSVKSGKGLSPDKRGRHTNRPKRTPDEVLASVREHINSFIKVPSHYVREKTRREYLEPNVRSVQNMYRLYKLWCAEKNYSKICSESMYRKTFNREFNLGFFLPRKDQCALCSRWKQASNNEEREKMLEEYRTHLTNKRTLKALRKKELEDVPPSTCIAAFDLQKVLTCPRSEVSSFFYRNKLSLFNFTVFECLVNVGHCYLWTEVDAKKGANEVGTNLYHFIVTKVADGVKDFVFYSDSPSGQNRNRMIFSMYLIASQKFGVNITHRFLETGHSYSEADSMHARIENEVTLKNIYSVEEWTGHIPNAKKEGETYIVNSLLNEKVFDLHYLVERQDWKNNTAKNKVMWSKVREVRASWARPNVLQYRNNFTEEMKSVKVTLNKKGKNEQICTESYTPPQAYKAKFPLMENKAKDIKWLLEEHAIPSIYHPYYLEILAIP